MTIQVLVKFKRSEGLSWDGQKIIANINSTPARGAANKKLEHVLARWLNIPFEQVNITKGQMSRTKSVDIDIDQANYDEALSRVPKPPLQLRITKN